MEGKWWGWGDDSADKAVCITEQAWDLSLECS